jgi:hypothetical protein
MESDREEGQKQHGQANRRIFPKVEDMKRRGSGDVLNRDSSPERLRGKYRSKSVDQ